MHHFWMFELNLGSCLVCVCVCVGGGGGGGGLRETRYRCFATGACVAYF